MSDMEHNKGKLVPFEMTEDVAKVLVVAKEGENSLDDCYQTYLEQLSDDYPWYDESLALVSGRWYKVHFEVEGGELYEFADVVPNEDGTINFNTWHYNGGAHWAEVVEKALADTL